MQHRSSQRRWVAILVIGLAALAACTRVPPKPATLRALRLQSQQAAEADALAAVREAVVGWKGGAMTEWSPADRQELDAALQDLDRGITTARRGARGGEAIRASTGGQGAATVTAQDTTDIDPRALYRRQGHRYELIVKATRAWLAEEGEGWSAERRHQIEAGLRAAKTSVFRLPTLEKQLLRQES